MPCPRVHAHTHTLATRCHGLPCPRTYTLASGHSLPWPALSTLACCAQPAVMSKHTMLCPDS